ncbi:MAG: hypothetical protein HC814_08390 [Rhodobacteraceae bacterium]|nr:hypothetical protein [Paracoccaceae bacterium]
MNILCLFGHAKEYVAIRTVNVESHVHNRHGDNHEFCKCVHGIYLDHECKECLRIAMIGQEARWACRRKGCQAMGQHPILRKNGLFKVEFGVLLPDKKGWANFESELDYIGKGKI